jgi:hypothetical protein
MCVREFSGGKGNPLWLEVDYPYVCRRGTTAYDDKEARLQIASSLDMPEHLPSKRTRVL